MPWLAVARAVVPSTAATALALATSQTLTRVRIFGLAWRASSSVARAAVEVIPRSCRHVPTARDPGPQSRPERPGPGVQLGAQPAGAPLRMAQADQVCHPGLDHRVEGAGQPCRRGDDERRDLTLGVHRAADHPDPLVRDEAEHGADPLPHERPRRETREDETGVDQPLLEVVAVVADVVVLTEPAHALGLVRQ